MVVLFIIIIIFTYRISFKVNDSLSVTFTLVSSNTLTVIDKPSAINEVSLTLYAT